MELIDEARVPGDAGRLHHYPARLEHVKKVLTRVVVDGRRGCPVEAAEG